MNNQDLQPDTESGTPADMLVADWIARRVKEDPLLEYDSFLVIKEAIRLALPYIDALLDLSDCVHVKPFELPWFLCAVCDRPVTRRASIKIPHAPHLRRCWECEIAREQSEEQNKNLKPEEA
jgi:hypothetical protein